MSVVQVDAAAPKVAVEDVLSVASKGGLKLSDQMAEDFVTLVSGLESVIASLPDDSCVVPVPDLSKYPRTDIHVPEDNELGGWAAKVSLLNLLPIRCIEADMTNHNRSQQSVQLPPVTCSKAGRSL
jgi:amidase